MAPTKNGRSTHAMTLRSATRAQESRSSSSASGSQIHEEVGPANADTAESPKRPSPVPDSDAESNTSVRPQKKPRLSQVSSDETSDDEIEEEQQEDADGDGTGESANQETQQVSNHTQSQLQHNAGEQQQPEKSDSDDGPQGGQSGNQPNEGSSEQPRVVRDDFWPNIRPHFMAAQHDEDIRIEIPCTVCLCLTRLPLPQSGSVNSDPESAMDYKEECVIMPCGHTIGADCYRQWVQTRANQLGPVCCPICRLRLSCSRCGEIFSEHILSDENAAHPPRTVPEGTVISAHCNFCTSENNFIRMATESHGISGEPAGSLLRLLFGQVAREEADALRRTDGGREGNGDMSYLIFLIAFVQIRRQLAQLENEIQEMRPLTIHWLANHLEELLIWNRVHTGESEEEEEESEASDVVLR